MEGQVAREWGADKPWPISCLSWLFDPTRTTRVEANYKDGVLQGPKIVPIGIDTYLFGLHIRGTGVLTGYLRSAIIQHDQYVIDVLGPGFGELMLLLPITLLASMAFVLIQRWCRPIKSPRHLVPFSARKSLAQSIGPMVGFYLSRLN